MVGGAAENNCLISSDAWWPESECDFIIFCVEYPHTLVSSFNLKKVFNPDFLNLNLCQAFEMENIYASSIDEEVKLTEYREHGQ